MSKIDRHNRPSDGAIRDALARILESETFARTERARELLDYVVSQEIAGEGDRLKGFSIAQDVFNRDSEFDSSTDAVVRVQAGRLRESLASYYDTEGSNAPIRIDIPRGTYVPTYAISEKITQSANAISDAGDPPVKKIAVTKTIAEENETPKVARNARGVLSSSDVPVSSFVVKNIRAIWIALALIIVLLFSIFFLVLARDQDQNARNLPAPKANAPIILPQSLPSLELSLTQGADQRLGAEVLRSITNAASRFSTVRLIDGSAESDEAVPVFLGRISPNENNTIDLEVVYNLDKSIIWSGNIALNDLSRDDRNFSLAGAFTTLLTPSGRLYSHLGQNGLLSDLAQCLWLTNAYYLRQDGERFVEAYKCYEVLMASDVPSALANADFASLMVERITDKYAYPEIMTRDDALAMARRSIEDGATAESYRALGVALSLFDDDVGREEAYRKSYTLNPYDLEIAAAYGWSLLQSRAFGESSIILKNVIENSSSERSWWAYSLFIAAYVSGDIEAADMAARRLAGSPRAHYLAARLIIAELVGNEALRLQLLENLQKLNTLVARDPSAYYSARYGVEAAAKLVAGLTNAGFSPKSAP